MGATFFFLFLILQTVLADLGFGRETGILITDVLKGKKVTRLAKYCYELQWCSLFASITGIDKEEGDLIFEVVVGVLEAQQYRVDNKVMLNIMNSETNSYYANFDCKSANTSVTHLHFVVYFPFIFIFRRISYLLDI